MECIEEEIDRGFSFKPFSFKIVCHEFEDKAEARREELRYTGAQRLLVALTRATLFRVCPFEMPPAPRNDMTARCGNFH